MKYHAVSFNVSDDEFYTYHYHDNEIILIEYNNGNYSYFKNNLLHREDGPAVSAWGEYFWYYMGKKIDCNNQQEFERIIKLKVFL